ncbi:MAG: transcription-repair coupling factor [Thermomicrobiales bacterium]
MALADLLPLLRDQRWFTEMMAATERSDGQGIPLPELPGAARPYVEAAVATYLGRPVLIITSRPDRAQEVIEAIGAYLPPDAVTLHHWQTPDALPYEVLPRDPVTAAPRLNILHRLATARDAGRCPVVVTAAGGLMRPVMPVEELRKHTTHLRVGTRFNERERLSEWIAWGYTTEPLVEQPGQLSRRGGIVDIFPPTMDSPVRIELFGDEIESIRQFDPATQRSSGRVDGVAIIPPVELPPWRAPAAATALADIDLDGLRPEIIAEWGRHRATLARGDVPPLGDGPLIPYFLPEMATLLDALPDDTLIIVDEPGAVRLAGTQLAAQAEELRAQFVQGGELPPNIRTPYLTWDAVQERIRARTHLNIGSSEETPGIGDEQFIPISLGFDPAPMFGGRLDQAMEAIRAASTVGERVVIATNQDQRMRELLLEADLYPMTRTNRLRAADDPVAHLSPPPKGGIELVHAVLPVGWRSAPLGTLVLSDRELFGVQTVTRRPTRRSQAAARTFIEGLVEGQYVVHIEHGVGLYRGLVTLTTSGAAREYLLIEYAGADRLYVPVDQTDRVAPYQAGGTEPTVHKLGGGEWTRMKSRVKRAVLDLADDLVKLYAARETAVRPGYGEDTPWDNALADSFPYEETADQQRAITEVRRDLEETEPMDRLLCGDVGFGKTEVALRAAFKVVNAGQQVAVLVPTTVLALQHFRTFRERLAAFPVRIEMLSRLRSARENEATAKALADGQIDIVIGTHRLLQKDIRFKRLGLIVVDEEQRFGVRHKERFKQMRAEVDVLTLTATPIPRTLHLSLIGVRDLSLIQTPPEERLPVRTFVTPYTESIVREVMLRELDRDGQVFFVHNRVQSIPHYYKMLTDLVPEARIGIGHGQMEDGKLEGVMLKFVQREYDVLLCTTIIESGLDIPNANTLIVDDATNYGLTQLYQLRGRVGRSSNRAYAYFLYDPTKPMTAEAQQRLEAIQEASDLGAGFQLAMRDLEIRGAGNILGAEQSGHIASVGFDLYTRLLHAAVEEARTGEATPEERPVSLDLPVTAFLPPSYVPDDPLRITLYRRIADLDTIVGVDEMSRELADRFGPVPPPVVGLLDLVRWKIRARGVGIEVINQIEHEIVLRPVPTPRLNQARLLRQFGREIRFTPNTVRLNARHLPDWRAALSITLTEIEAAAAQALPALAAAGMVRGS